MEKDKDSRYQALGRNVRLLIDGPVRRPLEALLLFHLEIFTCGLSTFPHSVERDGLITWKPLILDWEVRFLILK